MDCWLNIGVKGGAFWPTEETRVPFGGHELVLKPATATTEQSVHVNLVGIDEVDAYTLISRFLSVISWCDDQPLQDLGGWSGNPVPVAVPNEARVVGSSIAFPFYRDLDTDPKRRLALSLYREARTVNSIPYQFLGYFKILNVVWTDRRQDGFNPLVEGIREMLGQIKDQEARQRVHVLEGQESDVALYLYQSGRCAVAHAHLEPIIDPDDIKQVRRLSEDLWVIKALAEAVMIGPLGLSRTIF